MKHQQFSAIYNALKSITSDKSLNKDAVIEAIKSQLSPDSDEYKEWEKGGFSLDHVFITEGSFKASENTLLIRACNSADLEVVDCLLRAGADVNVTAEDENPLTVAIQKECDDPKHKDLVDLLIKKVNIYVGAAGENNIMIKAVERGNLRVFEALRKAGASLDVNPHGMTLLKWAENHQSDPKIIDILKTHSKGKEKTGPESTTEVKEPVSSETSPDNVVLNNSSKDAVDIQAAQSAASTSGSNVNPAEDNVSQEECDKENAEIVALIEVINTLDLEKVKTALEQDSIKAVASQWIQDGKSNGYPIFVHPVVVCLRDGGDLDNALKIKDEILKVALQGTQDFLPCDIMVNGMQYDSPEDYFRMANTVNATATLANGSNTSPAPTTGSTTPEKSLPDNKKEDTVDVTATSVNGSEASTEPTISNKTPEKNDTTFWSEHKGKIVLGGVTGLVAGAIAAYVLAYPAVALALAVLAAVILMGAGIAKVLEDPSVEKQFTPQQGVYR